MACGCYVYSKPYVYDLTCEELVHIHPICKELVSWIFLLCEKLGPSFHVKFRRVKNW